MGPVVGSEVLKSLFLKFAARGERRALLLGCEVRDLRRGAMARRLVLILTVLALVLVAAASGDDGGSVFGGSAATTAESTVTIAAEVSAGTIVVEALGEAWELPAAVCLDADGDADIVSAAAQQEAATVHSLVSQQLSGWPTTTAQPPDQQEVWARDLRVAGITALSLAGLVGEQAALEQAWVDWEQGLANPEEGWGPPQVISMEVGGWEADAGTLTQAIAAQCAGG
jgi:hypothetical protein